MQQPDMQMSAATDMASVWPVPTPPWASLSPSLLGGAASGAPNGRLIHPQSSLNSLVYTGVVQGNGQNTGCVGSGKPLPISEPQ